MSRYRRYDYDYNWRPYVPVAVRRREAEKVAAKAAKGGAALAPVTASRGAIAKTFWGKSWCENLERYSDYANRLPRGRTYVRNGSVIDLQIGEGVVQAQVVGSSLYRVTIGVAAVPAAQWQSIGKDCATSIDSLVELLQGRFSTAVMERICRPGTGLFPAPREIKLDCSCPDWAQMCKHVAAVLYGVGARLDQQPELLFRLRRVDPNDLVARAGSATPAAGKRPASTRVLDEAQLADVFGIEIDGAAAPGAAPRKAAAQRAPKEAAAVKPAQRAAKQGAAAKRLAPKVAASSAKPRKAQAPPGKSAKPVRAAAVPSKAAAKKPRARRGRFRPRSRTAPYCRRERGRRRRSS